MLQPVLTSTARARATVSRLAICVAAVSLSAAACTGAPATASPPASPPGVARPTAAAPSQQAPNAPAESPATPLPATPVPATPSPTTPTPPAGSPQTDISHPTDPTAVILRMDVGGGFQIPGWVISGTPVFTLYGDGTFVLRPQSDPERPDISTGLPRLVQGQMTEEYVQALLRYALVDGRLIDAREEYQAPCADCENTIFTIDAADVSKTVVVVGLGFEEEGPDAPARRAFAALRETILGLEERARSGELGDVVIYDPELYRVVLMEAFGDPAIEPLEWPWPDIPAADFEQQGDTFGRPLVMTRAEVGELLEVPSGGHPGIWVEAVDGTLWEVAVRALLPEEIADEQSDG